MPLTQGLHRAVQRHPQRTALVCGTRRTSWAELLQRVMRLAAVLRDRGVREGDRVAMLAPNSDRYLEALLATWWLGAAAVPLNTRWAAAELKAATDDCDVRLLLSAAPLIDTARTLQRPLLELNDTLEALIAETQPIADAHATGDTLAAILYTGGTTGRAKGVMLSHLNFWAAAVSRMAEIPNRPQWTTLVVTPLFHVAGLGRTAGQLITSATTVMLPGFRADAALDAIEAEQVHDVVFVPTMLQMLLDHPAFTPARVASLKRIIYGASPIAPALLDRAMATLPHVEFVQSYGMTETAATVCSNGPEQHGEPGRASGRIRAAGRASWCSEVIVADPQGRELPRGEVGELLIRGPHVMLGYWRQPDETAKALHGGWYHSGDGAWMDDEGYVFVVDRLKDMIVSGGENVYSGEVEAVLARHPAVATCAVIGVPSAEWGEAVHAVVVLQPGRGETSADLQAFCRGQLAGYKCPKSIELREALPLSAAGKVLKNELRAPFWQGLARQVN